MDEILRFAQNDAGNRSGCEINRYVILNAVKDFFTKVRRLKSGKLKDQSWKAINQKLMPKASLRDKPNNQKTNNQRITSNDQQKTNYEQRASMEKSDVRGPKLKDQRVRSKEKSLKQKDQRVKNKE